jgi:hypothetical protein
MSLCSWSERCWTQGSIYSVSILSFPFTVSFFFSLGPVGRPRGISCV